MEFFKGSWNPFAGGGGFANPYSFGTLDEETGDLTWDEESYNNYMQAVIRQQGQQAALKTVGQWAYKDRGHGAGGQPFFGPTKQKFDMVASKAGAPQEIDPRLFAGYQARLRAGPRGPSFRSPWIGGLV